MEVRHISAKGVARELRDVEESLRSIERSKGAEVQHILEDEDELWGVGDDVSNLERTIVKANRHTDGRPENRKRTRRRHPRGGPRMPWFV